ncbi:MAG: trypsin-like peptidase domain-containing protein [Planctomycetia bacterium]|nr:trypsin-like peptidase domain-containing protein [Planctomycetia bacterium]
MSLRVLYRKKVQTFGVWTLTLLLCTGISGFGEELSLDLEAPENTTEAQAKETEETPSTASGEEDFDLSALLDAQLLEEIKEDTSRISANSEEKTLEGEPKESVETEAAPVTEEKEEKTEPQKSAVKTAKTEKPDILSEKVSEEIFEKKAEPVAKPATSAPAVAAPVVNLREDAIVRAIRQARPAVVNIRGEKLMKSPSYNPALSDDAQHVNGMGTGVLIDPRGYIVTNYHVVDGIREIHVTTFEAKSYVARVLERDQETDLAIIKIDPEKGDQFQTIPMGKSDDLMTGETVIAVGNAFGYEHTVTRGIVSALHRSVQVSDVQFYEDLIQTDASINPGNSGGPLLNIQGDMIGINVAVRAGAQGIGFAIPVDRAMQVATRLISNHVARKNWHGMEFRHELLGGGPGAIVTAVEKGSPAADAGIQVGDIITAVSGQKITNEMDFVRALLDSRPGAQVPLKISRKGRPSGVQLAMGAVSHHPNASESDAVATHVADTSSPNDPSQQAAWTQLGVELTAVGKDRLGDKMGKTYKGGMLVKRVRPGSPASRQGIRAGDILLGMLRWETLTMDNILFILAQDDFHQADKVKFLIARKDSVMYGYLAPERTQTYVTTGY